MTLRSLFRLFATVALLRCTAGALDAQTLYYDGDGSNTGLNYSGLLTTAGSQTVSGSITASLNTTIGGTGIDRTIWMSFIGYRNQGMPSGTSAATYNTSSYAFNVSLTSGGTADVIGVGGYRGTGSGDYTTTGTLNGNATYDNPSYWALTSLDDNVRVGIRSAVSAIGTPGDFILLKVDYNVATNSDSLSLWINPSITGGEAGLGTAVLQLTNLDLSAVDGIRYYAGANATFGLDEVRIASAFETVVPEPSTYALLLGAGVLGLVAWRRPNRQA